MILLGFGKMRQTPPPVSTLPSAYGSQRRRLDNTLGYESAGERYEASNIGTADVVTGGTVLFGGLPSPAVDVLHDLFELLVGVL